MTMLKKSSHNFFKLANLGKKPFLQSDSASYTISFISEMNKAIKARTPNYLFTERLWSPSVGHELLGATV